MIELEDAELEKKLFSANAETLVPIEITLDKNGLRICSFNKTLDIAKEFKKRFSCAPFSKEAIAFLEESMLPLITSWKYFTDDYFPKHIYTFLASSVSDDLILPSTVFVKSIEKYENLTEYELEGNDDGYFVTVLENKIVSVCEINVSDAFINAKEINVYTNENYRKKGYGVSNVMAMTKYLLSKGEKVAYTAPKDNIASQKVAKKCGFDKISETYYYICYREE
ncbi:MAG: GNAT family N-acetyltransferase [Clostridia bacterium]|nr:GNAT family N-acetyltransferase [Clostridia bacterium]